MTGPTFKAGSKPSGMRAVKHPYASTAVLWDGQQVGVILPNYDDPINQPWTVELFIVDPSTRRGWRVLTLKEVFNGPKAAKKNLQDNWSTYSQSVNLHKIPK